MAGKRQAMAWTRQNMPLPFPTDASKAVENGGLWDRAAPPVGVGEGRFRLIATPAKPFIH
jgi:hypothetical protein